MYIVKVRVGGSSIDGKGVFAVGDVKKDTIVWKFTKGHDTKMSLEEYQRLDSKTRDSIKNTGYLSPTTGLYIFPPKDDPACFTNHSKANNLSTMFDQKISEEPYFIANRDIEAGDELTNNYLEFDRISQTLKPEWTNE